VEVRQTIIAGEGPAADDPPFKCVSSELKDGCPSTIEKASMDKPGVWFAEIVKLGESPQIRLSPRPSHAYVKNGSRDVNACKSSCVIQLESESKLDALFEPSLDDRDSVELKAQLLPASAYEFVSSAEISTGESAESAKPYDLHKAKMKEVRIVKPGELTLTYEGEEGEGMRERLHIRLARKNISALFTVSCFFWN